MLSVFPFFTFFNCEWAWKHKFGEEFKQMMGRDWLSRKKESKKARKKERKKERKNLWPRGGVKQTVIALHKYLSLMSFQPFYLGTRKEKPVEPEGETSDTRLRASAFAHTCCLSYAFNCIIGKHSITQAHANIEVWQ